MAFQTALTSMSTPASLAIQAPALADAAFGMREAGRPSARDEIAMGVLAAHMLEGLHELLQGLGRWQDTHGAIKGVAGLASPAAVVQRTNRLAADWLACSQAQRLCAAPVEPLPLLCTLAHVVHEMHYPRIDASVRVEPDCPPCLVDRQALEEALLHLVGNACAAMPMGGRLRFSAEACRLDDGRSFIELAVSDSGTGMTPEVAAHATKPFFTTRTQDAWAGLGLAAVAGFSVQSGGCMQLRSAPGSGTMVTLRLPEAVGGTRSGPTAPM
jgi:signal transduction histidine kinase